MQSRSMLSHHFMAEPGMAKSALRALPPFIAASTAHVTHDDSRLALLMLQVQPENNCISDRPLL